MTYSKWSLYPWHTSSTITQHCYQKNKMQIISQIYRIHNPTQMINIKCYVLQSYLIPLCVQYLRKSPEFRFVFILHSLSPTWDFLSKSYFLLTCFLWCLITCSRTRQVQPNSFLIPFSIDCYNYYYIPVKPYKQVIKDLVQPSPQSTSINPLWSFLIFFSYSRMLQNDPQESQDNIRNCNEPNQGNDPILRCIIR